MVMKQKWGRLGKLVERKEKHFGLLRRFGLIITVGLQSLLKRV
jgi:hypothetical protein